MHFQLNENSPKVGLNFREVGCDDFQFSDLVNSSPIQLPTSSLPARLSERNQRMTFFDEEQTENDFFSEGVNLFSSDNDESQQNEPVCEPEQNNLFDIDDLSQYVSKSQSDTAESAEAQTKEETPKRRRRTTKNPPKASYEKKKESGPMTAAEENLKRIRAQQAEASRNYRLRKAAREANKAKNSDKQDIQALFDEVASLKQMLTDAQNKALALEKKSSDALEREQKALEREAGANLLVTKLMSELTGVVRDRRNAKLQRKYEALSDLK